MPHLMLSWPDAVASAAFLAMVAAGIRLAGHFGALARAWTVWAGVAWEAALLFGLYGLWMFAGSFTMMGPRGALPRARWLWHAERVLHLPGETSVQRLFLPHPLLVQAFNLYYDVLHFPLLGACLIWVYARHRARYPGIRTTVALFTMISLLIQFIPVAPPRMLPATRMVDTAVRYGQSVYSSKGGFDADQLSAMPSVHVGWALIVAIAVITASRSRWRWLAAAYPLLTMLAVVVTANHFWLDGVVAGLLVVMVLGMQRLVCRLRSGKSSGRPQVTSVREEISVDHDAVATRGETVSGSAPGLRQTLRNTTPAALREQIIADHTARPMGRDAASPARRGRIPRTGTAPASPEQ